MITPLIILVLLASPYVVALILRMPSDRRRHAAILGIALVFTFTGVGHFLIPNEMVAMIPDLLPLRLEAVYISGVVEIALALLVLVPRLRRGVGWCLIVMLVMLLPLNIFAAIQRTPVGGHAWGPVYLLIRIPLQLVLIAWLYAFAVRRANETVVNAHATS